MAEQEALPQRPNIAILTRKQSTFGEILFIGFYPFRLVLDILAWIVIICVLIPIIFIFYIIILFIGLVILLSPKSLKSLKSLHSQIVRHGGLTIWASKVLVFSPYISWYYMLIQHIPVINDKVWSILISQLMSKSVRTLNEPIGLMGSGNDHVSLKSVYDDNRTSYHRWLPECDDKYNDKLPCVDAVVNNLFIRENSGGDFIKNKQNVTVLFSYYAQWVSHMFFNTSLDSPNELNQPIGFNMSNLYGSLDEITNKLRSGINGKLKSEFIPTNSKHEFPETVKNANTGRTEFNFVIPTMNESPGMAAINILFFRHHQYICESLISAYPNKYCDNELFSMAQLINILCCQSITINDYIDRTIKPGGTQLNYSTKLNSLFNTLVYKLLGPIPTNLQFGIEFQLLYRWHQLTPNKTFIQKKLNNNISNENDLIENECFPILSLDNTRNKWWNPYDMLTSKNGMERILKSGSVQICGEISLLNTHKFFAKQVIKPTIEKSRKCWKVQSYNNYRQKFGFGKITNWDDICNDTKIINRLKKLYKSIDDIEYYVGLFAEENDLNNLNGPLVTELAASWLLSIMMNRLNLLNINNLKDIITPLGIQIVNNCKYLQDLVDLHLSFPVTVTMKKI